MNFAKILQFVSNIIMVTTSIMLMYFGVLIMHDLETGNLVKVSGFIKVIGIMTLVVGNFLKRPGLFWRESCVRDFGRG